VISAPHFYVSGYLEEEKDIYIDSMRNVSLNGDWTSWCIFFLEALTNQAIRNLEIAENINVLYEDMKHKFNSILSSKWGVDALDFMFANPYFRNNRFTGTSGIPPHTAARFTRKLVDEGVLVTLEEASGRKPAMFMFEPLIEIVRV